MANRRDVTIFVAFYLIGSVVGAVIGAVILSALRG